MRLWNSSYSDHANLTNLSILMTVALKLVLVILAVVLIVRFLKQHRQLDAPCLHQPARTGRPLPRSMSRCSDCLGTWRYWMRWSRDAAPASHSHEPKPEVYHCGGTIDDDEEAEL